MPQAFSFGLEGSDIEESGDEMVDVDPSHDTLEKKSVTAAEPRLQPKLHKLQDLVWNGFLSFPHFGKRTSLLFRHSKCSECCRVLEETRHQSLVSSISMESYCMKQHI